MTTFNLSPARLRQGTAMATLSAISFGSAVIFVALFAVVSIVLAATARISSILSRIVPLVR